MTEPGYRSAAKRFALVGAVAIVATVLLSAQRQPILTTPFRIQSAPARATIAWRPGLSAIELKDVQVVRIPRGVRVFDLAPLRDDQFIETPSGRRMSAGRLRAITSAFERARAQISRHRAAQFAILPPPATSGTPARRGESAAEILARPATDVIRLPSGRSISVAQLRLMAPYIKRRYGIDVYRGSTGRGPAIAIHAMSDLLKMPKNTPDDTILQTPQGTRISLGALKAALKAQYGGRATNPNFRRDGQP